ncbi:MAG: radical SAM protein [Desulfobacteraceae bacterium]|nr:radical SAM protein [Desulfobacteraceae bacterium]
MSARKEKPYVIPIFIPHSGCPHRCTFCNQHSVTGSRQNLPDPEKLRQETGRWLQYKSRDRGFTEISFFGGNFLGLEKDTIRRLLDEAACWISSGKVHGIRFSTRPDTVDPETMRLIDKYPVTTVEIGVQSMDDRVLELLKRGHTSADSAAAANMLIKAGYSLGCQIMTGMPGESWDSARATAGAVADLKPDFVRIYPLVVLSGSVLAGEYKAGRFEPLDLEQCVRRTASLYKEFEKNRIPVIRMGLQSSKELNAQGTILAGPYHPALGHMVFSYLMLQRARRILDAVPWLPETVEMRVHPSSVSRMRGLKNANIRSLKSTYPRVRRFLVRPDPGVAQDEVVVAD